MKSYFVAAAAVGVLSLCTFLPALALDGEPYIHDPSTVVFSDGKFFTFGTGGGGLMSEDGWTWHSGAQHPGGGLAPDVIKIGDRYYMAYASGGGGLGGGHAGSIRVMWTKSLDPQSPNFKFNDETVVASSNGVEDNDAIDPSFLLDPTTNRLWLTYGTYFGNIRLVELDPKTGHRLAGNKPVDVAIDMEATDLIYRDGWYYLLGTHGTCCDGANSTYNIRITRSRKVTGPYLDNMGIDALKGGGKLLIAASGHLNGAGHFGRMVLGDGVEKFSFHWEADLSRSGRSVLDIRPLMWRDGWPVAGENFEEGTYEIESERSGYALELTVDFVRMDRGRGGFGGFGGGGRGGRGAGGAPPAPQPVTPVAPQELSQVQPGWPTGNIEVRLGDYLFRPHQEWKISPVADVGGYLGSPFFKIVIAGTDRALAATADNELVTVPAFTGAPEQLWEIDQLIDGTYRIMPKSMVHAKEPMVLTAVGASTPTLAKFDSKTDRSRWNLRKP